MDFATSLIRFFATLALEQAEICEERG